jgi:hypothetical protein
MLREMNTFAGACNNGQTTGANPRTAPRQPGVGAASRPPDRGAPLNMSHQGVKYIHLCG